MHPSAVSISKSMLLASQLWAFLIIIIKKKIIIIKVIIIIILLLLLFSRYKHQLVLLSNVSITSMHRSPIPYSYPNHLIVTKRIKEVMFRYF